MEEDGVKDLTRLGSFYSAGIGRPTRTRRRCAFGSSTDREVLELHNDDMARQWDPPSRETQERKALLGQLGQLTRVHTKEMVARLGLALAWKGSGSGPKNGWASSSGEKQKEGNGGPETKKMGRRFSISAQGQSEILYLVFLFRK